MDKAETLTLTKQELTDIVSEVAAKTVDEKMKASGIDEAKAKFNLSITGKSKEELQAMDAKQKMATFVKALYNRDMQTLASFKAMNEGTGSAGGFLVPDEFAAEVNRIVEDFGLVAKLGRKYPMVSDTLYVPRLSTSVSVYWPGENTAGTASQPVLAQVSLLAKTIVGITPMSNELLADANIDTVSFLAELFAEAIAGEIDSQGLAGTGAPFTGILSDSGVTVVQPANGGGQSTFTGASTPDLCRDMIANVKPWSLQGAGFIMHRTIWAVIQEKKASSGGDYFASAFGVMAPNATQSFPSAQAGVLWGYPVYLSDKMPALSASAASTKYIIFGNLKHVWVGVRAGMTVDISKEATVGSDSLFEKNMSAVRVTQRVAVAVGLPAAFSVLKTAAS